MVRSYKIYKSYHTSHHNTTKNHLQISTPPSSVQQRTDAHNLPNKHIESQASKLQASSNAPTFTTSLKTTRNLKLPNYRRPATRRRSQPPRQTHRISIFQTTGVQQRADAHNLPPNHMESQASKLQASSNAPTLTTSRQTTRKLSLSSQPSSAALMAHPTPVRPLYPSHHDRTV